MNRLKTDVVSCQRCGENHRALIFEPLLNPVDDYTHWAACPATGQPVLLMIRDTSVEEKFPLDTGRTERIS